MKTWTNVGIAVHGDTGLITFYASEGDAPLNTTTKALETSKIPKDYEIHFGMLVFSQTENPFMVPNHQDALDFNGITVDKIITGTEETNAQSPTPVPVQETTSPSNYVTPSKGSKCKVKK